MAVLAKFSAPEPKHLLILFANNQAVITTGCDFRHFSVVEKSNIGRPFQLLCTADATLASIVHLSTAKPRPDLRGLVQCQNMEVAKGNL